MSSGVVIACNVCGAVVPAGIFNSYEPVECSACRSPLIAAVFPAAFQNVKKGAVGETIAVDSDAGCFYHEDKRAAASGEYCGRFLCSLCRIDIDSQCLCSACVDVYKKEGKLENLTGTRRLYDAEALAWAVYPIIIWPFTCVTSLIALYTVFRFWNKPTSVVKRSKVRFVVAAVFALLEILGWIAAVLILTFTKGE